jgi:hypothetical protein
MQLQTSTVVCKEMQWEKEETYIFQGPGLYQIHRPILIAHFWNKTMFDLRF